MPVKLFFDKKGFISKEFGFTVVHTVVWHFSFQERKSLFIFLWGIGRVPGKNGFRMMMLLFIERVDV